MDLGFWLALVAIFFFQIWNLGGRWWWFVCAIVLAFMGFES